MPCSGELVSIMDNTALFSLISTYYGGDGRSTFGMPDLRGRVIVGEGSSPYYGNYRIGQFGGDVTTQIDNAHMPTHTHAVTLNLSDNTTTIMASSEDGTAKKPGGKNTTLAALVSDTDKVYNNKTPDTTLKVAGNTVTGTVEISNSGMGNPFNNMQPYLVLNPCILTQGIYPSRP